MVLVYKQVAVKKKISMGLSSKILFKISNLLILIAHFNTHLQNKTYKQIGTASSIYSFSVINLMICF